MIDIAFRTQTDRVAEKDLVRIIDENVFVIANAYADGWSPYWPNGSRVVLDLFSERWRGTRDLETAMSHVRAEFPSRAASLTGAANDDLAGEPGASLLAAHIEGDRVDVVWIGPEQLVVVRDGVAVSRTQPDTLLETAHAQGFDYRDSPHKHVLTRTIRRDDILPPRTARFALEKGDRVIVASEAVDGAIGGNTAREVLEMMPRDKFECVILVS